MSPLETAKHLMAICHVFSNMNGILLFPTVIQAQETMVNLQAWVNNYSDIVRHTRDEIMFDNNSKLFMKAASESVAKGLTINKLAIHEDVDHKYLEFILPSVDPKFNLIWFK